MKRIIIASLRIIVDSYKEIKKSWRPKTLRKPKLFTTGFITVAQCGCLDHKLLPELQLK
jgi:hypothetical protein